MPEPEVVKVETTPATGGTPIAQGAATGGDQSAWGQKFKSPDEMWTSYTELEKKLGTQGNELGTYKNAYTEIATKAQEYEKAVTAWDSWFKEKVGPNWDDIEKFLETKKGRAAVAQMTGQPQTQGGDPTSTAANWSEGWESLTPSQQAQKLQHVAVQQIAGALAPSLQNWQKQFTEKFNTELQQKEQYFQNYLNLYRRVMDMRLADPTLDVDAVLDNAVKVLSGGADPIEVGKQLATMTGSKEAYAKQMVDQARKDWDNEQKNKQMATIQPQAGNPPAFKLPSAGSVKGGLSSMREGVLKTILEKHGPSVL